MRLPGTVAKALARPLVWAVLITLLLSVVFFDAFPYDVLAYHGPFSAVATGLPGLSHYAMSPFMEHRFQGFPPLWRWLLAPGLGLRLPRLLVLPNLLALLALVWAARTTLRLPWAVSGAATLLVPIALFGFRTAYQDVFVGALSTAAALLVGHALWQWAEAGQGRRAAWQALPLLLAIALTKYQGLFLAGLILALAIPATLVIGARRRRAASSLWSGPWPVLLLTLLLCGLHPLHNLLSHHNPFFPVAAGPFTGPELKGSDESPAYTMALGPFKTFVNHWLSASEIDWIARGVVPSYNLDQARAQTQYGGLVDPRALRGLVRSGGSFGPAYLASMAAYAVASVQALRQWRREGSPSARGWAVLAAAPVLLLAAGLPQSHELRYYLPLLFLPALTALGWWWERGSRPWIQAGLLAFLSVSLVLNFTQPLYSTAKGLLRGSGLSYAVHYPVRDLPSAEDCRRQGLRLPGSADTLGLPAGQAFACRLRLPAAVHIVETDALPATVSEPSGQR
ncbi:MAG: hypothetical protein VKO44_02855 [Cyanobacteriota bacterium]|nr:hypothetical protein [Cyanobacteriota bacterium]